MLGNSAEVPVVAGEREFFSKLVVPYIVGFAISRDESKAMRSKEVHK